MRMWALRCGTEKIGVDAAGYDANPHTEELSKQLLPWGDEPCHTFDLTNELEEYDTFDLVTCLNVLSFVPKEKRRRFISNLIKLANKAILVSYEEYSESDGQELHQILAENNYKVNGFASKFFKEQTKNRQEYFLFELLNNKNLKK